MLTPFKTRLKLNNNMNPIDSKDIEAMQEVFYYMAMGCLIHVMTHIHLNLAYHVDQMAKYMANPSLVSWARNIKISKSHE
jgi:hypothetical protein